ncbi:MAG: TonB-dependent receptor [Bacteroidota bacterium]
MKKYAIYAFMLLLGISNSLIAQENGIIEGRLFNAKNNEPIPFANIVIWGTQIGAVSDLDGNFIFTGVKPGYVELRASAIGFETTITPDVFVTNAKKAYIDIPMNETQVALDEVVVKASPFRRSEESPVSLRRIGIAEIEKNPGGNRDISRVIQSLPGVASTPAFRNDVIVRGGGASENRFYLDGVEIPNLNHFATQGASGGPVGIINVDFVREVNFYSGAFPANRGNALSSVIEFNQIDGNQDKLKFRGAVGASDLALTLDGPLSDNTTFIMSARRSYLQFLFAALELPFLPTYNDFQFKVKTRINERNELTFVGLGALDLFDLNLDANETPDQRYILSFIPINEQWNYTVGMVYKRFRDRGFDTWVLSRNYLNNIAYKHINNDESLPKTFDFSSSEDENKLRYESTWLFDNGYKFVYGAGVEEAEYENNTLNRAFIGNSEQIIDYSSSLQIFNYSGFTQVSKGLFERRVILSAGARVDGSSYSDDMNNPFKQFSPRFSVSYQWLRDWAINFNTGMYFQRPPYTSLGYRNNEGVLVNKQNNIIYIQADHLVAGLEYTPNENSKISLEGFLKKYSDYPVSANDSVAIASKGADFGTFGDEEVVSYGEGRAFGLEVLARTRNFYGFTGILSYTLVRSEFRDVNSNLQPAGSYIPTAWDNRHILNVTATRSFKNNWDFGFKWRYVGGSPYTPIDEYTSSIVPAWDARGAAYLDFTRFNQLRLKGFHQLDVRVDKQFFFDKWSLLFYVDVQNIYNFKADEPDIFVREALFQVEPVENDPYIDGNGIERYQMRRIQSEGSGTVLPTIGIIVEI